MRIGYSFWGFLGPGIVDTPDGGRSHRAAWIKALRSAGHSIVFLQRDRDRLEAGEPISGAGEWDAGFPRIDLLFLEWRWPITGRSIGIAPSANGYCGDWDRQSALIAHYVTRARIPTIVWDKDLRLEPGSPLRQLPWVRVAEAALSPRGGARRLLFPIDDDWYRASLARLASEPPAAAAHHLVYIGNQYERDGAFEQLFAAPARSLPHAVFGKWVQTAAWPHVGFRGRVGFAAVPAIYRRSAATVLLAPPRYLAAGQFTQRIFEAQLEGCFTIAPGDAVGVDRVVPAWLIARSGDDVRSIVERAVEVRGSAGYHAAMAECLARLAPFLASRQLGAFEEILREL